jgi:hypothetical protein
MVRNRFAGVAAPALSDWTDSVCYSLMLLLGWQSIGGTVGSIAWPKNGGCGMND